MTQMDVVFTHLQRYKSISSKEAIKEYDITRLAAVIDRLERKGVAIGRQDCYTPTKYSKSTRYTRYYLIGEVDNG